MKRDGLTIRERRAEERWAAEETALDVIEQLWRIMWRAIGAGAVSLAIVLGVLCGVKVAHMSGLTIPWVVPPAVVALTGDANVGGGPIASYNPDTDERGIMIGLGHECTRRQLLCADCRKLLSLGGVVCIRFFEREGQLRFVYVCEKCPPAQGCAA